MRKELLRLESIHKSHVRRSFRMNLFEGEILALAGLTGSGISAVADILDGTAVIDGGYLWFDERRVPPDWFAKTRQGGIFRVHDRCSLVENMGGRRKHFCHPRPYAAGRHQTG